MFKFLKNKLKLIKSLTNFISIIIIITISFMIIFLLFLVYAPILTFKTLLIINYYVSYIKNIFNINFFILLLISIFIFVIITTKIYFYKSLILYLYLIINIFFFIFFNLNSYIGILVLVELMTITYINILVFNFTNFFNVLKNNNFKNNYFYFFYFLLILFDKSSYSKFNYFDAYHNYYPNDWFDNNDFLGIYLYLYFDNVFFLYFCGLNFVFLSIFFIKIFFVYLKDKLNIFFLIEEHLTNLFKTNNINFYEKNYFWEKILHNYVYIFK